MGFVEKKERNRSDKLDGWDSRYSCRSHQAPNFFFFLMEKLLSARALVEYSNDQLDDWAPASGPTGIEPWRAKANYARVTTFAVSSVDIYVA